VKALLMLAVLLAAVWLWRHRGSQTAANPSVKTQTRVPQEMLRCHQCGTHFPGTEAVTGQHGSYCCAEHLRLSEP
jgi:uncharacterized protein